MRPFVLILLLGISKWTVAQNSTIDSLSSALKGYVKNDTVMVDILNDLSYQYRWIDFSKSQGYAEQALKLARQLDYDRGIATADYRLGHCFWALGDNDLAIEKGLETVTIAQLRNLKPALTEGFLILARGYMDQNDGRKAERYVLKAEKTALEISNWDLLSRVYNLAGVIQFIKKDKDTALMLYNKGLSIIEKHPTSKAHLSQITSNIGECYLEKNQVLAFQYLHKALLISKAEETRNRSAEAAISSIIGHALVKKGDYNAAEGYLKASLTLSRELGFKRGVRYAYAGLVNLKVKEGKPIEALGYQKKYYEVNDSMLSQAKTRQIVELEARYELEKKEHAIQLLERDNKIQMLWANILGIVLAVIGILSVAIYYLQQHREQKNQMILNLQIDQLTTQNKELSEKYKNVLASGSEKAIESLDQRLFKKAIEVVENNISDPLFGVEQMSRELGMSRTNMHRKIKAITGFPPSELIRNIRLRKAAALLLNKADSVSQISLMVGFEDHSYFSKSFKKQFGITPSEYLQSNEQMN